MTEIEIIIRTMEDKSGDTFLNRNDVLVAIKKSYKQAGSMNAKHDLKFLFEQISGGTVNLEALKD
jgi:hypothetical protein